jgi:hypothetical protein
LSSLLQLLQLLLSSLLQLLQGSDNVQKII